MQQQQQQQQAQHQQQQGNPPQPIYHHQQIPPQLQQYQTQPTYATQSQYGMTQAQPPNQARQNTPNEQMQQNIYNQQMMAGLPQNVLYHQQQIQNHYSLQPIQQHRSPPNSNQANLPPQMHPSQANIYSQNNAAAIMSGAATLRRVPASVARDTVDHNPNANLPDNAIYERDKQQIFKYSTLRQGGKFDPRNFGPRASIPNGSQVAQPSKPSILNCPLPEIPKEHVTNGNDLNNVTSTRNLNANGTQNMNQPAMTR